MDESYRKFKEWIDQTKDDPLETMSGFFDVRINDYEDHMQQWKRHYEWMAELLPPCCETMLDIGCGTGLELDHIFARFPDLNVTGIDLSEKMLEKLRQKHPDKALRLICHDYFLYNFGVDCFDVAVSFETLHHYKIERKTALFEKICQCLKPGGIYLECDYIATSQAMEDLVFAECQRKRIRDGIDENTFVHFDTPLTIDHEIGAMQKAGFRTVELVGLLDHDDHTAMIKAIK